MWHLIQNELLRFRGRAIAFGAIHLGVLGALAALGSLFVPVSVHLDTGLLGLALPAYVIAGVVFGLAQARAYGQPTLWMVLLHRPLSPRRIFLALATAAVLLLLGTVALPLLTVTVVVDHLSARWIDLRQYGMTPLALGSALCGYFAGLAIALSPQRVAGRRVAAGTLAGATLLLPMIFLSRDSSGWWCLAGMLGVLVWLGGLAGAHFEPDRTQLAQRPLVVALGGLPVQMILFWCLMLVGLLAYTARVVFVESGLGLRGFAAHSWNNYFAPGTFARMTYLHGGDVLEHGLDLAPTVRSRAARAQIDLDAAVEITPRWSWTAKRHQPIFLDRQQSLADRERSRRFIFSHDRGLFQGWHEHSLSVTGWLGTTGLATTLDRQSAVLGAFADVPIVVDDRQVVVRNQVYMLDPQPMRFDLRFTGERNERFVTPLVEHERFAYLLSDRRLILFPGGNEAGAGRLVPSVVLPLPDVVRNLSKVVVAPFDRGFVVSFVFGVLSERDHLPARQVVLTAFGDGRTETLVDVPLAPGPPAWSRHWGFIMSPVLQVLDDLVWTGLGPRRYRGLTVGDVLSMRPPGQVVALALFVAALAAFLTALLASRRQGPGQPRWAWIIGAVCLGLPGFLSFLFLMPRREMPRRALSPRPIESGTADRGG